MKAEADRSSADRQFFVTATSDIGDMIRKGDRVLIDPDAVPQLGKYVLIDGRLVLFNGQGRSEGVAVQANRDLIRDWSAARLDREAANDPSW